MRLTGKAISIIILFVISTGLSISQNNQTTEKYKILLIGASFATPNNSWVELACKKLEALLLFNRTKSFATNIRL